MPFMVKRMSNNVFLKLFVSFDRKRDCKVAVTLWPSGLRRNVKAVVLIGGGSNPLDVTPFCFAAIKLGDLCRRQPLLTSVEGIPPPVVMR